MVFATDSDPIAPSSRRQADLRRVTHASSAYSASVKSVRLAVDEVAIAPRGLPGVSIGVSTGVSTRASKRSGLSGADPSAQPVAPLPLPVKPVLPLGLKILNYVQQGSTVVTSVLIGGALVLYGSSVYVDKSANRVMTQLNQLQGESQQLTSANESIKQSLAEQAAQAGSGLEPYEAGDVLFVTPGAARETTELPESSTERTKPLGY